VVVRARTAEGAWGAPSKTVVPGWAGPTAELGDALGPAAAVLLHLPAGGAAKVTAGSRVLDALPPSPGAPFPLPAWTSGLASVGCSAEVQAWRSEPGRELDLYF
jgi:hypothetical protein